jgi:hypothetical protein
MELWTNTPCGDQNEQVVHAYIAVSIEIFGTTAIVPRCDQLK